jgi:PPE-repeat protein
MLFPPEINSGLIYSGPGSAPLMEAATGWDGLAADLSSTATSIHSVMSGLGGQWTGPSAAAATSATTPYVTWLESTAAQAALMGTQAKTAAGLFETAHAASVPPPVITANRALLMALISTNFFGQNTPAIMATEAQYEAMWAQDGAAMDSYHGASQANVATLAKPTPAPQVSQPLAAQPVADPSGPASQGSSLLNGVTGHDGGNISGLWNALMNAFSGTGAADPTGGLGSGLGSGAGIGNAFRALYYPALFASLPARILPSLLMSLARAAGAGGLGSAASAGATGATAGPTALMTQIGEFVDGKLHGAVGTLVGHFNSATNAISAKLGQAASMGSLKVPQAWSSAAEGLNRAAPVLPNTTVSARFRICRPRGGCPAARSAMRSWGRWPAAAWAPWPQRPPK